MGVIFVYQITIFYFDECYDSTGMPQRGGLLSVDERGNLYYPTKIDRHCPLNGRYKAEFNTNIRVFVYSEGNKFLLRQLFDISDKQFCHSTLSWMPGALEFMGW